MRNIFQHRHIEGDEPPVNMTREEEQATLRAMLENPFGDLIATPGPATSRWSRTSYSASIYTQDSRFDDDVITLRAPTPALAQSSPYASTVVEDEVEKDDIMHKRLQIWVAVFVALSILGIILGVLIDHGFGGAASPSTTTHNTTASLSTSPNHFAGPHSTTDSGTTSTFSSASTSTTQQHSAAIPSTTSIPPTSSPASTVDVVQVATEVVRTTVGTLTTSALTSAATLASTSTQNPTASAQ